MKRWHALLCPLLLALAACSGKSEGAAQPPPRLETASRASTSPPVAAVPQHSNTGTHVFSPPPRSAMPSGPFGAAVRQGQAIFTDTGRYAKAYVGNGLTCSNCHLDGGRLANSAPLWGAYVRYPQYRSKNKQVNNFGERIQGCFLYSMNGKAPPLDSKTMVALESYAYWLSKGAPTGAKLVGAGYPKQGFKPPRPPDYARGKAVYVRDCALCHGAQGQGQKAAGRYVFPPLWGADSFNWGAGMHELNNAAAFIKANMPLSRGDTLNDQDAWDVAMYMDAHERPQDPRFRGNLSATRKQYHNTPMSLYGTVVNGHLLGSQPSRK